MDQGGWGLQQHQCLVACLLRGGVYCNCTHTWGAAWNLKEFIHTPPGYVRVGFLPEVNDAWLGDIIFADWDSPTGHSPDGRVDHVMIVTGKDAEGNTYISQHTTGRKDYPFTSTQQAEPNAIFYAYRVKESY